MERVLRRRGLTGRNNQEGETDDQKSQRRQSFLRLRTWAFRYSSLGFEPGTESNS